ncbi:hypothetical protein WMF26_36365 [Sorangium sp. So ce185]|uniref:hypothetical protein n=1 Tax=Sorangium sp. So ce185 TaxID=3133287 RepID=UPI003F5FEED2
MTNDASRATPGDLVARTARAMTDLPGGTTDAPTRQDISSVPDIFSVSVDTPKLRLNAFLQITGGRVSVPTGLAEAGRRLSMIRALDKKDWGGGLAYVVGALGGMTPGWPDVLLATESLGEAGGVRVTLRMTEPWLAYAAAGGVGHAPRGAPIEGRRGGIAPPLPEGTATLDIGPDYALRWSYTFDGRDLGSCAAPAAKEAPALSDGELLDALEGARHRAMAPRAVPGSAPRPHDAARYPGVVVVDFCALGPVYVDLKLAGAAAEERLAALGVGASTPPAVLVPLLQAVGALPPGLLVTDLLPSARITSGELVADVPAPLVEWAASCGTQLSPRIPRAGVDMTRKGRVRLRLGGAIDWALEVEEGAGRWRRAGEE